MSSPTLISSLLGKRVELTPYPLPPLETQPRSPTNSTRESAVDIERARRRSLQPADVREEVLNAHHSSILARYAVDNVGAAADDISHLMATCARIEEDVLSRNATPYRYHDILRRICACVDERSKNAFLAAEELGLCFSYGNTARKLRAARLWAIMLRYCSSEALVGETSSKWFLRPIKAICLDEAGHAGLYTRTREIVAGAALLYPGRAFADLWKSVKRADEPAEGIPFRNPLFIIPSTIPPGSRAALDDPMSPPTSPLAESPQSEIAPYRGSRAASASSLPHKSSAKSLMLERSVRPLSIATVASAATLPPYSEERCFILDGGMDAGPGFAPPDYE